jgi:hypothetical protein
VVLLGLFNLGWVAYNLFVEEQPQFSGARPALGMGLGVLLLYVGLRLMFGKTPR